jgi:Na+-translocating ferredoxin:NAD+ oxidoreductase RNF subunit RnfB
MTIGALIAIGAIVGVDEAALEVLREVCSGCRFSLYKCLHCLFRFGPLS